MNENELKQLSEATKLMVSLHFDIFCKYMKLTDQDIGTSISLANAMLHEVMQMNAKKE